MSNRLSFPPIFPRLPTVAPSNHSISACREGAALEAAVHHRPDSLNGGLRGERRLSSALLLLRRTTGGSFRCRTFPSSVVQARSSQANRLLLCSLVDPYIINFYNLRLARYCRYLLLASSWHYHYIGLPNDCPQCICPNCEHVAEK